MPKILATINRVLSLLDASAGAFQRQLTSVPLPTARSLAVICFTTQYSFHTRRKDFSFRKHLQDALTQAPSEAHVECRVGGLLLDMEKRQYLGM